MAADSTDFRESPTGLTRAAFVARFGGIYEDSPWIAEALWDAGLTPAHGTLDGLASALAGIVAGAGRARQLALIRAHPDLAGKAALAGAVTEESQGEQAAAGLDRCSPAELRRFHDLNAAYKARFGFPFILAVKGLDRAAILAAFEARLAHDPETEFATALAQIDRIARLRLTALTAAP